MSQRPSDSLSTNLFYDLLVYTSEATKKVAPIIALLRHETTLFLDALPDDNTKIIVLQAKLKAHQQTHNYASFAEHVYNEVSNGLMGDGFRCRPGNW